MATARAHDSLQQPSSHDKKLIDTIAKTLVAGALPGETNGFEKVDRVAAATLVLVALGKRARGKVSMAAETGNDASGRRLMRLAIVNDDMPFLVDSIAATVAAHDLDIYRVLHPLIAVKRDGAGFSGFGGDARESLVYMDVERADARGRRELLSSIETNLGHVRAAVRDWSAMKDALARDVALVNADGGSQEGAALLAWMLDRNLTLVGHAHFAANGTISDGLGLAPLIGDAALAPESRQLAIEWLKTHEAPLVVKSNFISTVHRRAPLDLIILPVKDANGDDGLSIHMGLWTSSALTAAPQDIPVLRQRLAALETKYGFDPAGHAGKALTHALTALPHDLLIGIGAEALEDVALTAMSLADRPRTRLLLARDALDRHMFAFAWLPRDELSTARRVAIGEMLAEASGGTMLNWSIDLGDSGVALIRYTFDRRGSQRRADGDALDRQLEKMVRGWQPSVEASLGERGDAGRAARLAIRYSGAFPIPYRLGAGPEEAALDIERLYGLADPAQRGVRIYRNADDAADRLRLKLYSLTPVMLSDAVPALENFGFRVVEEVSTELTEQLGHMHRFVLDLAKDNAADVLKRADVVEAAIASVLEGSAEDDRFNELLIAVALSPKSAVLFRALFRYLRQTGLTYGLSTVADALLHEPEIARAIVALFFARHDPAGRKKAKTAAEAADLAIESGLVQVAAIDEDRILRLFRSVVMATLRTNFFAPAAAEAIAFKFDSAEVPGLPAPVPWREIFVYSPRVEGIHLRAGPVARGGLRWSDRRDDFRTEILGLMKAQRVKNAVIVPTGAKGGFFPKALPDAATNRDAWLAEGTETYRIFIRTLLSITDNIIDNKIVHPDSVVILDGDDPYFVVAADKGTASFSDVANAIALERNFWLGDAFASGGSVGYDHKAMAITARGAWISVQRHFAELGVDVQTQPVRVVGCGDMSGDVFGNGMLLSKSLKIVAAFDHRHIFLDPDPDPAVSWEERARMFALPRSSWADYNPKLISNGGGVFSRSLKSIKIGPQMQEVLGITSASLDPSALIVAILKSPADLIWFGGIGTYLKAASEPNNTVGDPANDANRINAEDVRARVVGEGANLGVTQAARIVFSLKGGRINTDFIDNSAGVDCSDHEVNIKIALNAEVAGGVLTMPKRNALLVKMTDQVAELVLEDNRLQTLALSIAERGGAPAIPSLVRLIETFESSGRLDRAVEGLPVNEILNRRAQEGAGFTRPELAVLLATAKLALQDAIENSEVALDPAMAPELLTAFPVQMRKNAHADAIAHHRLRGEIVATKIANRLINRLGLTHPFELAEEEGAALGDIAAAFVVVEQLYNLGDLWASIDAADTSESARLMLFEQVAVEVRAQMADLLRNAISGRSVGEAVKALAPSIALLDQGTGDLIRDELRTQSRDFERRLTEAGAPKKLVDRVVHLAELDGAIGLASLAGRAGVETVALTQAFTQLGAALGLDWAQGTAMRLQPIDPWERLLIASLARDFQQMRLEFLAREAGSPEKHVTDWLTTHANRVAQFRHLIDRARIVALPSAAMLAQIAGQARVLLGR
ncbi:glutamate dehydrogenase [Sphingomonas paeninsulae]|uniref:Glutamate dehydrogenase n=1 Tax=Sphingomonas paeninsulae TaxID=2319844 RepID=A0A494TCC5_SPHPE|nr:NAD-glutamate dehydrogenase domain-containing protein [Sphingomonas paeninsulae]AYJ86810.1 glutamate dehydrogenase [Sphingomonas paeninsulae]